MHWIGSSHTCPIDISRPDPWQAIAKLSCTIWRSSRIRLSSHFYADDVQLYLSCRHGHTAVCASRVSACIDDITKWMASNRLMINPIPRLTSYGVRQVNQHLIHHFPQPVLPYNRRTAFVILVCCSTATCLSRFTSTSLYCSLLQFSAPYQDVHQS